MGAAIASIIPENERERLAAVRRYEILDTPPDGTFDRITSLAARLFDVPVAIVSLVDEDRIWFKSHHGLEVNEIGRDPGLCASAVLQNEPWLVENAELDPRTLANPIVAGEAGFRFYAGIPLMTADGHGLGTLCVLDYRPRSLTSSEIATLEDLAQMVLDGLEVRLASRRAIQEATEREHLKDAFLGMLSHELRTPVTTIHAAATILSRNEAVLTDERARDLFPDIVDESQRMLDLIENLLVLTRVEQGRLDVGSEPILLQRVVPGLIAREHRRSPERVVRYAGPSDLSPVSGDQVYVEQVVGNLLSNALKYSDAEVEIYASESPEHVEVRVRDRGIGLPAASREVVFELLARTSEATLVAPGAGIGLYVCRRLLDVMGGSIWIEPVSGPGTVFGFRLPKLSD